MKFIIIIIMIIIIIHKISDWLRIKGPIPARVK